MKLAENPDRFLSSVQVGITLTGMSSGNKISAMSADYYRWIDSHLSVRLILLLHFSFSGPSITKSLENMSDGPHAP